MRRLAIWLTLVVGLLGGGCSHQQTEPGGLSEGCLLNTDCADPLVCAFRKCHVACEGTRDCNGGRCVVSERPLHVCQLSEELTCSYNSDCPIGQSCGADSQCRDQCQGDTDCL